MRNLDTGAAVTIAAEQVRWDADWKRLTVRIGPGSLADGNYRVTLAAGSVTDAAGNPLPAAATLDFFVFSGDVNRDRRVDGSDFALLAFNFGRTGMTYGQGDLNGDGNVNGSDFALLAGNFGKTMPAPAERAYVPAPAVAPPQRVAKGAVRQTARAKAAPARVAMRATRPRISVRIG